jgi:hypothetical protein
LEDVLEDFTAEYRIETAVTERYVFSIVYQVNRFLAVVMGLIFDINADVFVYGEKITIGFISTAYVQ